MKPELTLLTILLTIFTLTNLSILMPQVIKLIKKNRQKSDNPFPEVLIDREKFHTRKALIEAAFQNSTGTLELENLVKAMKNTRNKELANLYFAGSFGDHPYFLKNEKISLGISILPEDAEKTGKIKRHPHQEEIIVLLSGELMINIEENGKKAIKILGEGETFRVPKNCPHQILPSGEGSAIFLFLKTNPAKEPMAVLTTFSNS